MCLVIGDCWYCVNVVCVSYYKVDVVIVRVVCVRNSVVGLCVDSCSEVEAYRCVDKLFDVDVFYNGGYVEVVASWFL
jgi:hypothetical protein